MTELLFGFLNRFPFIARLASRIGWLRRFISDLYINKQANSANPRPRPFSMAAPYTTWQALSDRTYTSRHLPEAENGQNLPPIGDIVELWRRRDNREILSANTSLLFSFFAQWFTDSFLRTDLLDRRKNTSNHEIDLCQIYGLREEVTNRLRLRREGKLKYQLIDGEVFPPYLFDVEATTAAHWVFASADFEQLHPRYALDFIFNNVPEARLQRMFAVGLEHGNSAVGYTVINTIMLRQHNQICDELRSAHPQWDDERLFQTARNIMIVLLINIVIRDYIGHFSQLEFILQPSPGMWERQRWNRTNWIALEFNLLYRWHSMVPEAFVTQRQTFSLDDFRNNTPLVVSEGVGALITAASQQRVGQIGLHNTPDFFFQPLPFGDDQRSVMERTMAMSRQARLRSFNDYREAFSMRRLSNFDQLTDDEELRAELQQLYHDRIDDLEWHVGVFAEKPDPGFMLGRLMTLMVGYDAFTHALTNPLMSIYVHNEQTFSRVGMDLIASTHTLADIVRRTVRDSDQVIASFRTPL